MLQVLPVRIRSCLESLLTEMSLSRLRRRCCCCRCCCCRRCCCRPLYSRCRRRHRHRGRRGRR